MKVSMNDIGILIYASSAYQYYNVRMDRTCILTCQTIKNKLTIEFSILIVSLLSASIVSMYYTVIHTFNCRPDRLTIKTV